MFSRLGRMMMWWIPVALADGRVTMKRATQMLRLTRGTGERDAVLRPMIAAAWVALGLGLLQTGPAFAGIAVSIPPNYPPNVNLGQMNVPVSVVLTNNSADDPGNPGVDTNRQITIDTVFHTPACDIVDPTFQCPAGKREPGVFQVVGPAIGTGGFSGWPGTGADGGPRS